MMNTKRIMEKEEALEKVKIINAKIEKVGLKSRAMFKFFNDKYMSSRVNTRIRNSSTFKTECDVLNTEIARHNRILYALMAKSKKILDEQIEISYAKMFCK